MNYIKELETHRLKVSAAKIVHVKNGEWERATACRDVEKMIEAQIEKAKKALDNDMAEYIIP